MSRPFHMSDLAEGQTAQRCTPLVLTSQPQHVISGVGKPPALSGIE